MKTFFALSLLGLLATSAFAAQSTAKKSQIVELCGYKIAEDKINVMAEPSFSDLVIKEAYAEGAADVIICSAGKDKDPSFSDMIAVISLDKDRHAMSADKYFYLHAVK